MDISGQISIISAYIWSLSGDMYENGIYETIVLVDDFVRTNLFPSRSHKVHGVPLGVKTRSRSNFMSDDHR